MAQQSGAAVQKKPASSAATDAYTGEDRISALPDDLLVLILLCLPTMTEAVRTIVLSHRCRPVWKRLPELRFDDDGPDLHRIRELIDVPDPDPEALAPAELRLSAAAWLPAAARRVTGGLVFYNHDDVGFWSDEESEEAEMETGVVQLPCFTKAMGIELDLGFLKLALPSAGTFARFTELRFYRVVFQRPCLLGDVVSSPRCPSLQGLTVKMSRGIDGGVLAIRSESLLCVHVSRLTGFHRLRMATPAMQRLDMAYCLETSEQEDYEGDDGDNGSGAAEGNANDPIVDITAPQLESLGWDDKYDPEAVHFGNVEQLKRLRSYLYVYLQHGNDLNDNCQRLLQRFQVIEKLTLLLVFKKDLADDLRYAMGDITMLPKIMSLKLSVRNKSHAFGACCFHLLRMCTSIQRLTFQFFEARDKVQCFCKQGCLCEQPTEWKTEKLTLMHLEEIVIINTNGTDHEIATFRRVIDWAIMLKSLRLHYHSNTERKANEVCQKLKSFARLDTCITLEELPK